LVKVTARMLRYESGLLIKNFRYSTVRRKVFPEPAEALYMVSCGMRG